LLRCGDRDASLGDMARPCMTTSTACRLIYDVAENHPHHSLFVLIALKNGESVAIFSLFLFLVLSIVCLVPISRMLVYACTATCLCARKFQRK
jgi:hypothetical protein